MKTNGFGAATLAVLLILLIGRPELAQGSVSPMVLPGRDSVSIRGFRTLPDATESFELPEPIEPTQLADLLRDQPSSYAVVDVRPAWQFREYHVPGATNIDPNAVLAHVRSLPKSARVVLVDRDGTVAWAVGGAMSAALGPESRLLRVVAGGTVRFWREVEFPGHAPAAVPGAQAPPATQGAQTTPAAAPSSPAASPAKPETKKRSAGC